MSNQHGRYACGTAQCSPYVVSLNESGKTQTGIYSVDLPMFIVDTGTAIPAPARTATASGWPRANAGRTLPAMQKDDRVQLSATFQPLLSRDWMEFCSRPVFIFG
jgi:hypothetical protein